MTLGVYRVEGTLAMMKPKWLKFLIVADARYGT